MYVAIAPDAVATIRADARRCSARRAWMRRIWQRIAIARASRADRMVADMARELRHAGVIDERRVANGRR